MGNLTGISKTDFTNNGYSNLAKVLGGQELPELPKPQTYLKLVKNQKVEPLTIAFLDDERIIRMKGSAYLKRKFPDLNIQTLEGFKQGLDYFSKKRPKTAVICLDNRLEDKSFGTDLISKILSSNPNIKIISISNNPEDIVGTRYEKYYEFILEKQNKGNDFLGKAVAYALHGYKRQI